MGYKYTPIAQEVPYIQYTIFCTIIFYSRRRYIKPGYTRLKLSYLLLLFVYEKLMDSRAPNCRPLPNVQSWLASFSTPPTNDDWNGECLLANAFNMKRQNCRKVLTQFNNMTEEHSKETKWCCGVLVRVSCMSMYSRCPVCVVHNLLLLAPFSLQ